MITIQVEMINGKISLGNIRPDGSYQYSPLPADIDTKTKINDMLKKACRGKEYRVAYHKNVQIAE